MFSGQVNYDILIILSNHWIEIENQDREYIHTPLILKQMNVYLFMFDQIREMDRR